MKENPKDLWDDPLALAVEAMPADEVFAALHQAGIDIDSQLALLKKELAFYDQYGQYPSRETSEIL